MAITLVLVADASQGKARVVLAAELKVVNYAVEVKVFPLRSYPSGCAKNLFEDLLTQNIAVDILVNNAGMMFWSKKLTQQSYLKFE